MSQWLKVYLLPGAIFVSVVLGGGYGTGREVVEYFTSYGLKGGLLGVGVATLAFALILVCTFEYARLHRAYDYRTFFKHLLGRFWWLFEVLYALLFLLVLGVVSSAAGEMFQTQTGLSSSLGVVLMLALIALLILLGRTWLEGILTYWSAGMYLVFALYLVLIISGAEINLVTEVAQGVTKPGWFVGGLLYTMYNVAVAPVLLFTARVLQTRKHAVGAGVIAAVLVMLPAIAFHLSYAVDLAAATAAPLPNYQMIQQYAPEWLLVLFLIALMGTLVQTGAGLLQGVIERVAHAIQPTASDANRTELPIRTRSGLAVVALTISGGLSSFGIVALIAQGYSAMAIGFGLVYVAPLLVTTVLTSLRRKPPVDVSAL